MHCRLVEYQVTLSKVALRDLEKIRNYIARDNPLAAENFCQKLLDEAESLARFPERGAPIAHRPGARFTLVYPYLVVYRILESKRVVLVQRFWHGARERLRLRA